MHNQFDGPSYEMGGDQNEQLISRREQALMSKIDVFLQTRPVRALYDLYLASRIYDNGEWDAALMVEKRAYVRHGNDPRLSRYRKEKIVTSRFTWGYAEAKLIGRLQAFLELTGKTEENRIEHLSSTDRLEFIRFLKTIQPVYLDQVEDLVTP